MQEIKLPQTPQWKEMVYSAIAHQYHATTSVMNLVKRQKCVEIDPSFLRAEVNHALMTQINALEIALKALVVKYEGKDRASLEMEAKLKRASHNRVSILKLVQKVDGELNSKINEYIQSLNDEHKKMFVGNWSPNYSLRYGQLPSEGENGYLLDFGVFHRPTLLTLRWHIQNGFEANLDLVSALNNGVIRSV